MNLIRQSLALACRGRTAKTAILFSSAIWAIISSSASAQVRPHAGMMRFPDVSAESIVFVYGEDLWIAPRTGGMATPLASPSGEEMLPRFSPDGKTIAFVGNYDGNQDIYTIPVSGGAAKRVTYHPSGELLCDWTPDGKLLYSSDCFAGLGRQAQLYVRSSDQPIPDRLAVPYGTNGAISSDGQWLAYTPHSHDYRTWKRYRGGMASDIWLFDLKSGNSQQITDFEGTDSLPMWHGSTVYYVSDAGPEHRLNIWSYDTKSTERKQVTQFADNDCKFPSIGPGVDGKGEIVVQNGKALYLIELPIGKATEVKITVPGDRPKLRPKSVDASQFIAQMHISPSAKRIALEARGDIWTVPVKTGSPRNLSRTSGVAERMPTWSGDGKWISYLSDATGEYELYIANSEDGSGAKQLTQGGTCYRFGPSWSPDSKWIYFYDKTGAMFLHSIERNETKNIDRDPTSQPVRVNWSHNSEWITYAKNDNVRTPNTAIWIFNVNNGTKLRLTSGFFNDQSPVFDRKGEHIFYSSNRAFNSPKYEDVGSTFIYSGTEVLMAMPLRGDIKPLLAVESDEEKGTSADDKKTDDKKSDEKNGDDKAGSSKSEEGVKAIVIDSEGIEARAIRVPVAQGNFGRLAVNDKGQLIYGRVNARGEDDDEDGPRAGSIKLFDFSAKDLKEVGVVDGQSQFGITYDGKKLLVVGGGNKCWVVDSAAGQKLESEVSFQGMNVQIDPAQEWKQVLRDAWRIERDYFYDPNMHGVNWSATYDHYAAMLEDCVSRRDVSFLIREMISELNVGHAYYNEGDVEQAPQASGAVLGARLELHDGAFRVAELYQGAAWDDDARNPLVMHRVKVGDYLLAINGLPVDSSVDPYASLQRLAGKVVSLTFSSDTKIDDSDKKFATKLMGSDSGLRFRQWIEANRKYVEAKSEGKIGYIYVVNTGVPGQNDLVRQLYGQFNKEALIIDDRWNGGGQIPTRFIELLNRPATNYWALRDGRDWVWPTDSHQGPKCMLTNGMAGSGGDMFPLLFRQSKLGKLIGTRTWGGLVGISGNPNMIDGSSVTAPTFAFYEHDGTWGVEGHGVDPDIMVMDDPAKLAKGVDPQLDAAIKLMLEELPTKGFKQPNRPAYPDRKGFGIKPEDK
ncbi:MAG: S41 family peptidase [Pirellulales bacterium]